MDIQKKNMSDFVLYKNIWIDKSNICNSCEISVGFAKDLLKKGGLLVRNSYNWDKKTPSTFWFIIKDSFGGIEELPSKVRNQVRKSLKTYDFRIVTHEQMQNFGLGLYNKSRKRFGNAKFEVSAEWWNNRISGDNLEFWMGFDRGTGIPASFAINTVFKDYVDYSTIGISPDFPNNTYPMYGLFHEMNRYYLAEKHVPFVCDGVRSLTDHSNIQPFLEQKFKFRRAYCDIQVFYKSWFGVIVRVIFPFRRLIKVDKVQAILRQEAWVRGKDS